MKEKAGFGKLVWGGELCRVWLGGGGKVRLGEGGGTVVGVTAGWPHTHI